MTVSGYLGRSDAIEDDDAVFRHDCQYFSHDLFKFSSMSSDEYGIGLGESRQIGFEEVAYMAADTWRTQLPGILLDDGLTGRSNLKGFRRASMETLPVQKPMSQST